MFFVPLVIAIIIWRLRPIRTVASLEMYTPQVPTLIRRRDFPFWLMTLSAMLAITTVHQFSVSYNAHVPEASVSNLAIVLDMSGSMNAVDWPEQQPLPADFSSVHMPPSRLQSAKQHIRELLSNLPHSRVALLAFAQNTVLVSPLSENHDYLLNRLDTLTPELFQDGTAIGNALQAALLALRHAPSGPRTVILLSDGVDHSDSQSPPLTAAREALSQGITIHTVAIGGVQALHPVSTEHGLRWENVGEPLDEAQLTTIASTSGGMRFSAPDAQQLAQAIRSIRQSVHQQSSSHLVPRSLSINPLLLSLAFLFALWAFSLKHHEQTTH